MTSQTTTPIGILPILRRMRSQRKRLSLLIFGRGARADAIQIEADQVVENYAALALIVRIADPAVLRDEFPELAALAEQGYEVICLSLSFRVAAKLRGAAALDFNALDEALLRATEID